jgi:hypothetical protein
MDSRRSRDCRRSRDRGVRDARFVWPRHSCRIVADDLFAERRLFADGAGAAVDHASPGNQGGTRQRHRCQWGRLQHQSRRGACSRGLSHHRIGIAAPFWLDGFGNLVLIAALLWWRSPRKPAERPPAERLTSAVRAGLRFAANSRNLRAILIRAMAFFPFACASWALLPLVARSQMTQGPECYGTLLSMIGAGPSEVVCAELAEGQART